MLCKSCGQEIDTWEVCPHCGTVQADAPAPQPAPVKPADIPAKKPSGLAKAALIILCVLGILHMLPLMIHNVIGDVSTIRSLAEFSVYYGFDFDFFYIAETILGIGMYALYLLAILIGFILLIACKPKAAILVPALGFLWYLFLILVSVIGFLRNDYSLDWLSSTPWYLFYLIPYLIMAACILLGKLEWLALAPVLPAGFYILRGTIGMIEWVFSQIYDAGSFTQLLDTLTLSFLESQLISNMLNTALILFCIAYVVCVRTKKKQHQPA